MTKNTQDVPCVIWIKISISVITFEPLCSNAKEYIRKLPCYCKKCFAAPIHYLFKQSRCLWDSLNKNFNQRQKIKMKQFGYTSMLVEKVNFWLPSINKK